MVYRQSQPGAFAHTFGSEKRVEYQLQIFLGNTTTVIGEYDFSHGYGLITQFSAAKFGMIFGPDRDASLAFDGMLCIHQHVHDDLLDQVLVDPHCRQLIIEVHDDINIFGLRCLFDQVRGFFNQLVEIGE